MNPIEIGFDFTGKESAKDLAQALIPLISSVQATGEAMHNLASEDITSRLNSYQKAIEAIYTMDCQKPPANAGSGWNNIQ